MTSVYDVVPRIAELYDQQENFTDDLSLIRKLLEGKGRLNILEPFCGTGRILIPLALDGHHLTGLDQSQGMLERAQAKVSDLPEEVQARITLRQADVTLGGWPAGFDLVILGGNCMYELATPEDQANVIHSAALALNPGGYLYLDSDHMEGELAAAWQTPGEHPSFPSGACADGARLESSMETIWFDAPHRLARFRRRYRLTLLNGQVIENETVQQKHPVSMAEVKGWLEESGLTILSTYGNHNGQPYTDTAERIIFWARKKS